METKTFTLTENGFELEQAMPILPQYSRVYSFGGGSCQSTWVVIDDKNNLVKISTNYEADYFRHPFHRIDKYNKPISKKFGIGFYWDDIEPDFRFSQVQVEEAIAAANLFIDEYAKKEQNKKEKNQKEQAELPAQYQHLVPGKDRKNTMNNIRTELKHNFPGIKFSVTNAHGSTVNIRWEDGPTTDEVSNYTSKFKDSHSDITGDFNDYDPSNFNRVFGGMSYVFVDRDMSNN